MKKKNSEGEKYNCIDSDRSAIGHEENNELVSGKIMKFNSGKAPLRTRDFRSILMFVLFAVIAGVVFHALWKPGAVLMTSDDNLGLISAVRRMTQASLLANWTGEALWGMPGISGLHLWALTVRLLPPDVFMNVYHGLCLFFSAWFLALYLRDKGLRTAACVFGGLVAFWVGTNLTLIYAGHIGKYGTMMFLSLSVFALGRWGKTGRAAWAVLAGSAAGAMFLEQPDVSLFCALLLIPLGLFEASKAAGGWKFGVIAKQSWVAALAAALIAGGVSLAAMGSGVTKVPGQSEADNWSYITQWSQPPGESLDFIAPGWTGWRSGDPDGPYWGKMGRSDGWEQTRQGFMNFKLENVYVGVLPLFFAVIGLVEAVRKRREDKNAPAVFLWGGLCLAALLLSFGKFFPLYRLLSMLPGFGSIRNPNKFIHFFQMAWGILAAFGLNEALRMDSAALRRWRHVAAAAAAGFLIFGLTQWANLGAGSLDQITNQWADQLGVPSAARMVPEQWSQLTDMAKAIEWNKAFSVTYAGFILLIGAGVLWLLHTVVKNGSQGGRKSSSALNTPVSRLVVFGMWLPVAAVVFDAAVILAPRYIQTMPAGYVAENELTRYLKNELGYNRTAMATQDGFYNQWLTYLFPYHGIPSVNVTQLPRPPADYVAFWGAVKDPVRTWRLAAVSHVLAHAQVAAQLMANPAWAKYLKIDWAYQPTDDGCGGVATRQIPAGRQAPEVVLKMKDVPPRAVAAYSWREVSDDEALRTLANPAFEPFTSVLLAPGSGVPPAQAVTNMPGSVMISKLVPGRYEFTVENKGPAVIRVSEKYDPDWRATVDGRPVPVLRTDFMFQGIALMDAGRHDVVLSYAPPMLPVLMQASGLLAGLGALLWLAVTGLMRSRVVA